MIRLGPWFSRATPKEYGSNWTFYWRIGRWVIEVNFGREKRFPP